MSTPQPKANEAPVQPPAQHKIGGYLLKLTMMILALGLTGYGLIRFTSAMLSHAFTPDLAWILQSGHYILQHQSLPTHDIFSWTNPEKPWVLYQWLFEALAAVGEKQLGLQGLLRAFTVLTVGLYLIVPLILGKVRKIPALFTLLVCALMLVSISINISLRPMIISSICLALQYILIHQYRSQKWGWGLLVAVLAFMYTFWANMHTGIVLGFLSLGLMALGDWLQNKGWYRYTPVKAEFEAAPLSLKQYAVLVCCGFMASLINPYGWGIYSYLADLSSQSYLNNLIIELQSPDFHLVPYRMFIVAFCLFLFTLPNVRRHYSASEILHLVVFTFSMFFVQRFVVWMGLFYVLILPKGLFLSWLDIKPRLNARLQNLMDDMHLTYPAICSGLLVCIISFTALPHLFKPFLYGRCESVLKGIATYQSLKQPTDRVLMDSDMGSCTLLNYPQQKVFVDTRFDFYGQDFVQEQRTATMLSGDWEGYLKKWRINTVVMHKRWSLTWLLAEQPGFEKLYEGNSMMIFRRKP